MIEVGSRVEIAFNRHVPDGSRGTYQTEPEHGEVLAVEGDKAKVLVEKQFGNGPITKRPRMIPLEKLREI